MLYTTLDVVWEGQHRLRGRDGDGLEVTMDTTVAVGGEGTAATPLQHLLYGLAGCTMLDVITILNKKREKVEGLSVRLEADRRDEHPRIANRIRLLFTVEGDVSAKAISDAIALSKNRYCSVGGMLSDEVEVTVSWQRPGGEPIEVSVD